MKFLSEADIRPLVQLAFKEDIGNGDVTSEAIFTGNETSEAFITAKDEGIFCGGPILNMVYNELDPSVSVKIYFKEGDHVKKGDLVAEISGHTKSILIGERTALNFMQRMCGIATKTSRLVQLLEGTSIKILDTRKTCPGHRLLDKYSVKAGGGHNHRIGLFDSILIKDNHIKCAGSITAAVEKVRAKWGGMFMIEVETENLEEVKEAVQVKPDIIMLDNMSKDTIKEAIAIINKATKIELSGNMNEEKINNLKDLDIDFISIGALTHSVDAFDLSMKFRF